MQATPRRKITRNRELLACSECRRRKLRCDRGTPCMGCRKRGNEDACTYQRSLSKLEHDRERRVQAEARLGRLEQLVQQLAQNEKGSEPLRREAISQLSTIQATTGEEPIETDARISTTNTPVLHGSTNWSSMLEDLRELREVVLPIDNDFIDEEDSDGEQATGSNFILSSRPLLSFQTILNRYLPERRDVDRLTASYFRNIGASAPFIHTSQFRRLYQGFWKDPSNVPVLWVSMLFSICHIARTTLSAGKVSESREIKYDDAAAHCLVLGEYHRPKKFSVESLLLYVQARCWAGLGISSDIGLLLGLLVRLATSMKYHRDPSLFRFSAFEAEMRRRVWSLCLQMDLMISFHLGIPSNVQYPTWDTPPPRNLEDSEFDETTEELPLPRPDSKLTGVLFYIAKHRLMAVFEKILRHTLATGTDSFTNVDDLDHEISSLYLALPEVLRPLKLADSTTDSTSLIVTRMCVFFLYQKCLCVLHRPYVIHSRVSSISICHSAASNIVQYINDTYEEFLPGGQLEAERWFLSSITWQDYLLGVMALCLTLCVSNQRNLGVDLQNAESLGLLEQARQICMDEQTRSKDTDRIRRVVDATLSYFEKTRTRAPATWMDAPVPSHNPFESQQPNLAADTIDERFYTFSSVELGSNGQAEHSQIGSDPLNFTMNDPSMVYLEQFLDLSADDFVPQP